MSGNKILVDTNIAIYFLSGFKDIEKYFYTFRPILSFISELELLSGPIFDIEQSNNIKAFLSNQIILDYQPAMKDFIVKIRQKNKFKLADAIIAATAIYLDIPLVSSDRSFGNGLKFFYYVPA